MTAVTRSHRRLRLARIRLWLAKREMYAAMRAVEDDIYAQPCALLRKQAE